MKIQDIAKIKWLKGNVWQEKWYNTELCFLSLEEGVNPIYDLATKVGCSSIALNTQWFHEEKTYKKQEEDFKRALQRNDAFISGVIKLSENYIKEAEAVLKKVEKAKEINDILLKEIKNAFMQLWYVFLADLGEYLPTVIDDKLSAKKLNDKDIEEIKNYYFLNTLPLAFQKENENLKKIVSFYKKRYGEKIVNLDKLPKDVKNLLSKHNKQFEWLMSDELDTSTYSLEDYYKKFRQMLFSKKQSPKTKPSLSMKTKKLLNRDTLVFLEMVNKHLFLDNYAADLYTKIEFFFLKLLEKRLGIGFKELSWYSWKDMELLVNRHSKLSKEKLGERQNYRVMVQIDGQIGYFYGKGDFDRVAALVNFYAKAHKRTKIHGLIASKGIVLGKVKIVRSVNDMDKINSGDILVATTTRPDLMPAILRAAAIVTDKGGITSHAAIVSRELNIPCIVATQIATEVLKDGDSIEVNADKGIITILK